MRNKNKKITYAPDWMLFWTGFIHSKVNESICEDWGKKKSAKLQGIIHEVNKECENQIFEIRKEARVALAMKSDAKKKLIDAEVVEESDSDVLAIEEIRDKRRKSAEKKDAERTITDVKIRISELKERMDNIFANHETSLGVILSNAKSKVTAYMMGVHAAGNKKCQIDVSMNDLEKYIFSGHLEIDAKIIGEAKKVLKDED